MPRASARDSSAPIRLPLWLTTPQLPEFVDFAKANPGKVSYATSGAGSSNHLLGARLEQIISAGLVHVPYRGAGPAMIDTIAGNVPVMFDSPALGRAAHQGRQGECAGGQRRDAQPCLPRRADHEGAGLSRPDFLFMVRHLGAREDAAADRRSHRDRDAGRAEGARRHQALGGDRRRGQHHDAGRGDALHPGRDRQMDAGREGFGRQARLSFHQEEDTT
ncbi:hypothetical protein OSTOST_13673 [Ostertagia ostertagi]